MSRTAAEALLGAAGRQSRTSAPRGACRPLDLHSGSPAERHCQRLHACIRAEMAHFRAAPTILAELKAGAVDVHGRPLQKHFWGQPGTTPSAPRGACLPVRLQSAAPANGSSREQMPEAGGSYGLLSGRPFLSVTMAANATSVYVQQAVDTSKRSWASVALLLEVLACRLTCMWLLLPYTCAVQASHCHSPLCRSLALVRSLLALAVLHLHLPLGDRTLQHNGAPFAGPHPAVRRHVCAGPGLLRHLQQRRHPEAAALCGVRWASLLESRTSAARSIS